MTTQLRGRLAALVLAVGVLSILASSVAYCAAAIEQNADKDMVVKCTYTNKPLKIDGRMDEAAWKDATPFTFFNAETGEPAIGKTMARVLWDDKYLYVGFKAYDKDVWSYLTERDAWTYEEDCLEVYLKTEPEKKPYFDFEINAIGDVMDMYVIDEHRGITPLHRWLMWNCKGLKTGIYVKGTLNNPDDVDEYWQMEVAIPFADLPSLHGNSPKPGDKWKTLLARYDYSVYLAKGMEMSTFRAMKTTSFHDSDQWLPLEFVK